MIYATPATLPAGRPPPSASHADLVPSGCMPLDRQFEPLGPGIGWVVGRERIARVSGVGVPNAL